MRNNINRIVWLDESLATDFEGSTEKLINSGTFFKIVSNLSHNMNLPKMGDLDFSKGNIITKDYDAYLLFTVVGRYLNETKKKDELLAYVQDEKTILKDGDVILDKSLKYFKKKYKSNGYW